MTSNVKIFKNVFPYSATEHWSTFRDQIWWKSAVAKLPKGGVVYHRKNLALRGTRPSSHFAQNGLIAPKITWTLSPLDMSAYTEFCPDRLRFAGLIPKRLLFRPKKSINIRLSAIDLLKYPALSPIKWCSSEWPSVTEGNIQLQEFVGKSFCGPLLKKL